MLRMAKKEVEKRTNHLRNSDRTVHTEGEKQQDIGEGVSRYLSCTAAKGRTYEGAEGSGTVEAGGVINSWPIPSRMASNLCYREAHPSHTLVLVLYTSARTLKRQQPCAGPALAKGGQQSQPGVTAQHPEKTLLYTPRCGKMPY